MGIKTNDPQVTVTTKCKIGAGGGELITFNVRLGWFQLVAIVPIPDEGQTEGKAYIKFKILNPEHTPAHAQTRADREEVREEK